MKQELVLLQYFNRVLTAQHLLTYLIKVGSYYSVQYSLTVCAVHHNKGRNLPEGRSTIKAYINTGHCCPWNFSFPVICSLMRGRSPPRACSSP